MNAREILEFLGIAGALFGAAKAAFAIARFFIELASSVRALTDSVQGLTQKFDDHASLVTSDMTTLRERVSALESWREEAA